MYIHAKSSSLPLSLTSAITRSLHLYLFLSLFHHLPHFPLSPPHFLLPPLSFSHTHTVKVEIITSLPPLTRVQSGHDVNLNCTARGTNLTFQWSYRERTYDSTSDCRNGICVNTELSSSDPLSKTSHLSISGLETTIEGDTTVTCHVTQRVDDKFGSIPLTSIGILTVYDEVLTTSK